MSLWIYVALYALVVLIFHDADMSTGHAHGATYGNWASQPEPKTHPIVWVLRTPFMLVGGVVAAAVYVVTLGFCCEQCTSAEDPGLPRDGYGIRK